MQVIIELLIRHGLTLGAGWLFANGLVDKSDTEKLISAVMTLVGIGWSIYHKMQVKRQLSAAESPVRITVH